MASDEILKLSIIRKYFNDIKSALNNLPVEPILEVVNILQKARLERKTVYIFGNGGSAATASHCACDFSRGANHEELPRLKTVALNDRIPVITALANDESYDWVFSEQLEDFIEEGDIAVGISVSGNSPNILNGIITAHKKGAVTIGFTSNSGGQLKDIVDISVRVPLDNMEQAEDLHLVLEHVITTCMRVYSPEPVLVRNKLSRQRSSNVDKDNSDL